MNKFLSSPFLTFLFSGIVLFSCSTKDEESKKSLTVQINENNIIPFDEAIESIEFIPLKNDSDSPVNLNCSVWRLLVQDERIIYSTICNPDAKIHLYDLAGEHLKTIDKAGDGPEEYQFIQGMNLIQDTLTISVGSGVLKSFLLPDFEFIGSQKLSESFPFLLTFLEYSPGQWLVSPMFMGELDENGTYPVFKNYNSATNSISDLPLRATALTAEISEGEIAQIDPQTHLLNYAFSDTLFLFKEGKTEAFSVIDFGNGKMAKVDLGMDAQDFEATVVNQPYAFNMGKIWYTDSISRIKTFALSPNPDMDISNMRSFPIHEVFINHENNQAVAFPSFAGWSNGFGDAKDGYFYDVLQTEDWIYALEKGSFGSFGEVLEKQLSELNGFEDPILIKYKVKFD